MAVLNFDDRNLFTFYLLVTKLHFLSSQAYWIAKWPNGGLIVRAAIKILRRGSFKFLWSGFIQFLFISYQNTFF